MFKIIYYFILESKTQPDAASDNIVETNVENKNQDTSGKNHNLTMIIILKNPLILLPVKCFLINVYYTFLNLI